ncbi:NitT/TauT family transport system ATP-binding protein [Rhodopseudomonas julia]|uniref:NitT/TauT family transport system ATP-binding protein n=1 Tax=Rhodopseudomonas julia TaxID=200617 RepID=A0ABU0CBN9_9BRAD|nr:NitT/TauT family transport system ATP-binding protein [Rhodopseudomonas julia]
MGAKVLPFHTALHGQLGVPHADKVEDHAFSVRIEAKRFKRANGGEVEVIRDLSFVLTPHTFTCLLGPSGCGKTTTLKIMLGLDADFSGAVSPALQRARFAAVFQEPRLLPWRSVEDNIRLALPPEMAEKDLTPVLDAVELNAFRSAYPSELSLGMARRVALARAFSVEPEILLLDEPFVSLDEMTANRLRHLLLELWQSRPVTVLMVTHNIREAARLADRLIVLSPPPAHVAGTTEISLPHAGRSGGALSHLLVDLAHRFPSLALE